MPLILLILLFGGAGGLIYRRYRLAQKRQALLATPLPDHEREILHAEIPLLARLPTEFHAPLEGKINLFLDQVAMYGCDGLDLTDEMMLSIAGQACLLVVNTDAWYNNLRTVLVYPGAFKSMQTERDGFVVQEKEVIRLGESWSRGPVILSWAHSQGGAMNDADGHNVVLHEFAHQLDDLSGATNGLPILNKRQSYADWERIFLAAFERHLKKVRQRRKTVLDAYGAQNHQEFLAVTIEAFFEKPRQLQADEPALYAQVGQLLQLDPAEWG